MTAESLIAELQEWPKGARVIVTLVQGDKIPRRFEIDELVCEPENAGEEPETGEIIIVESGEF